MAESLVIRIGEDIGEGTQPRPFPPSVGDLVVTATNLAFAIELYIKVVLVLSQVDVPRGREGHDLGKLYSSTPQHFKVIIERFYNERRKDWKGRRSCITVSKGPADPPEWDDHSSESPDIGALLDRAGDLFSSWRYIYEFTDPGQGEYQLHRFEYGLLLSACQAMQDTVKMSRKPSTETGL